ncbi:hypothetical protein CYMTET_5964 [Cymbomonas tetramitiformis]|uniref:Uncharacterized protein n=1 Tax=Cymbomonas tetramitiformis TaxID=36881 RepID=A0AAE0GY23_9CHLO|nr:hypothetical protein CYMTET_5964 [Cymbomonas tetramitiformis]
MTAWLGESVYIHEHSPATRAEDHEDAVRICVPRQSNRPPFGLAEPTNVLFSVQEFFGYVQAISDLHEPGFKKHTWEDIFSDPLDLADDPGTVHFRQHKWLLEPPIGINLQGMVLKIRDAIASGEPYHRPPELVSDGDRRMNPQRLTPSPPAPMDEVVDMTYTEVHEPEDPPPERPTRRRMKGPVAHRSMPPTPVELAGETQGDDGAAVGITSNRDPLPPERPTRRRMKGPVAHRNMPPTPVELAGETQGDDGAAVGITSNRDPLPPERPTRRRMKGPVAHRNMPPTPVELAGETQEDDGAAVGITSNRDPLPPERPTRRRMKGPVAHRNMPPTPVEMAGETQEHDGAAVGITSNRDPLPPEMPTRRRMKGPVAHRNMPPTPVELAGETQDDDGAAVGITSNRGPGMVVCDCGACHSSMRFVTMRTRSRHRTMFKQIVCLPTLPEEAVDDDEQHPDGEESDQEDADSGSLDDADADGNLPDPEAVQEELDELLDHVDPELARKVTEEIEGKLKSLENLADMEVTFAV